SSPFLRARQTAAILAERLALAVRVEKDLREQSFGELAGQPYAALHDASDYDPARYWLWRPPGGETLVEVAARAGAALDRVAAAGLRHFQTTLRNPQRFGNTDVPTEDDCRAYLSAVAAGPPLWGLVHGSLLVNLASPEGRIRNASVSSVLGDLRLARELGLAGVCFHVGYAKGHPDRASALKQAVRKLAALVEEAP